MKPLWTRPSPEIFLSRWRWLRICSGMAGGVCLIALIATDHSGLLGEHGHDRGRYHDRLVNVVRVIDGDTIDIDLPDGDWPTTRVRLWGVDTPETAKPDLGREAEPWADIASEMTLELIGDNPIRLHLEAHRTRGGFGRLLAYVTLSDGTILNERLLLAGVAEAEERWSHSKLKRFALLQDQAQRDQVGLWSKVK